MPHRGDERAAGWAGTKVRGCRHHASHFLGWSPGALCPHGRTEARSAFARSRWRTMGHAKRSHDRYCPRRGSVGSVDGLAEIPFFSGGTNPAQGLLPQGIFESLVWIPLALSAGFCEELVFRGYLQKQKVTGSAGLAVLFQAIVFGVGHLYEGVAPVALITLYGVLYGLLAVWRKSLRPGMIAHAWSDIFGVIIFRGM
jgi:hypothetical protein